MSLYIYSQSVQFLRKPPEHFVSLYIYSQSVLEAYVRTVLVVLHNKCVNDEMFWRVLLYANQHDLAVWRFQEAHIYNNYS